ncbi:hypothetical protein GCM10012286_68080 [Streptomyces lasiicapitis]|uniref:Uncharacterized protein n=1 Tax=Streptomyces lasiicapitis TaxID=1923961 RepID=A0ABQ2MPN6_9ACTN|nr:hypothetical protein GCM10012286_68080 [Streptomyces lasiicapitis]
MAMSEPSDVLCVLCRAVSRGAASHLFIATYVQLQASSRSTVKLISPSS